ncbi:MAG: TetR/AcrR family transcriptional regulator [Pseudoclavibacter sp.]
MARPGGLREAKRRATIELIERAAIELALDRGHEQVTVDAICSETGIARSTFFNHFHSRESAIFGPGVNIMPAEEAFPILDAAAPNVLEGAFAVTLASVRTTSLNREIAALRVRIAREQPTALVHATQMVGAGQVALSMVVGTWLSRHPEHATMPPERLEDEVAYIVGAVVTVGFRLTASPTVQTEDAELSVERFRQHIADYRAILESTGDAQTGAGRQK